MTNSKSSGSCCENCFYYIKSDSARTENPYGPECHKNAPLRNNWWPRVNPWEWCGDYKAKSIASEPGCDGDAIVIAQLDENDKATLSRCDLESLASRLSKYYRLMQITKTLLSAISAANCTCDSGILGVPKHDLEMAQQLILDLEA